MPSTPHRRALLRAGGTTLLGALAGCLATGDGPRTAAETEAAADPETADPEATTDPLPATPTATGTYADAPDGPESYPDRPETVTRDAAVAYAEAFEHARVTNHLHEPTVEEMNVESRAVHDAGGDGGHYAVATASGYATYEDGVHADWGQRPALYVLTPALTVRVEELDDRYFDCEEVFAAPDPAENFAGVCDGGSAAYRAYNLSTGSRTLSVTVEFLGDEGAERVLERTYEMASATGLLQGSVTYRRGTYRLTAALGTGRTATARWSLSSEPTAEDPPPTVIVTPVGDVAIRRPPFHELR